MRAIAIGLLLTTGCLGHGEDYTVRISPYFTAEEIEGIQNGGSDWEKWVPVHFKYVVDDCKSGPGEHEMCLTPVGSDTFDDPPHTWGITYCEFLKDDSCQVHLAIDRHLSKAVWQGLAAHEMGHAIGFRRPDWPNDGHEAVGSGALMAPTLESTEVTCTDMARWYTVRKMVVPQCP